MPEDRVGAGEHSLEGVLVALDERHQHQPGVRAAHRAHADIENVDHLELAARVAGHGELHEVEAAVEVEDAQLHRPQPVDLHDAPVGEERALLALLCERGPGLRQASAEALLEASSRLLGQGHSGHGALEERVEVHARGEGISASGEIGRHRFTERSELSFGDGSGGEDEGQQRERHEARRILTRAQ